MNWLDLPIGSFADIATAAAAVVAAAAAILWSGNNYIRNRQEQKFRDRQQYMLESMLRRGSPDDVERLAPYLFERSRTDFVQQERIEQILDRLERSVSFQSRALESVAERASMTASEIAGNIIRKTISDEIGHLRSATLNIVSSQEGDAPSIAEIPPVETRPIAREISHALFTPLARIEALCRTLEEGKDGQVLSEEISGMRVAVQICFAYLNAFRATAFRPKSGFPDLRAAIAESTYLYAKQLGKNIHLEVGTPEGAVNADSYYLLACALPLIENAVDAVVDGESIEIDVSESASETKFSVRNPVKTRVPPQKVFRDGYTTKGESGSDHEGLGLGIARSLAAARGGVVALENARGKVNFSVTLPKEAS